MLRIIIFIIKLFIWSLLPFSNLVSCYRECRAIGYPLDRDRKRGSSITLRSP